MIVGTFVDHPEFAGRHGHTSQVLEEVEMNDGTIEIETLNSRYTLNDIQARPSDLHGRDDTEQRVAQPRRACDWMAPVPYWISEQSRVLQY